MTTLDHPAPATRPAMRPYRVKIKNGTRVLADFTCMAPDSCSAVAQHLGLADWFGGYLWVQDASVRDTA